LKPLRKTDGSKLTIDDVRNLANPPSTTDSDGNVIPGGPGSAASSKFFLQGGVFNVNSTNAAAWAAVLRSTRFPTPQSFRYHDVATDTGTAGDEALAPVQSGDAQFFRFSLSAQETYKAEWPPANADPTITPPRTDLFRKGMRSLTGAEVWALAQKIVELIRARHAASGPFRSLEDFLATATPGNPSLLEQAIADTGTNANIPEFSSQWLTQADIMTALAPVLFPRSDTFVIRTYGEAVNPVTGNTEGRAWCEAVVQRIPDYFDPTDAAETSPTPVITPANPDDPASVPTSVSLLTQLNQTYGRRFKVVSFRWLTKSDI
jgi:hypothetical protein